MREKKAAAQAALLDRIIELAPSARPEHIKELAEAFSVLKENDYSKDPARPKVV